MDMGDGVIQGLEAINLAAEGLPWQLNITAGGWLS